MRSEQRAREVIWAEWYNASFAGRLVEAEDEFRRVNLGIHAVEQEIAGGELLPWLH